MRYERVTEGLINQFVFTLYQKAGENSRDNSRYRVRIVGKQSAISSIQ